MIIINRTKQNIEVINEAENASTGIQPGQASIDINRGHATFDRDNKFLLEWDDTRVIYGVFHTCRFNFRLVGNNMTISNKTGPVSATVSVLGS